ncbi:hypothetical protein [Streptomyces sp. KL116D]|uniref:hypothetical protein n=1 Tax=Streptomyces sp. KL116D TaxID=3045152 RepID=UPI003557123C
MTGDVVNRSTGATVAHIGSFRLPIASRPLQGVGRGLRRAVSDGGCAQRVTVTYGTPTGTEGGVTYTGGLPTVTDPTSGSCLSSTRRRTPRRVDR